MALVQDLMDQIAAAKAEHHRKVTAGECTVREEAESGRYVINLQKRLSAAIADGAKPCPKCGAAPMGVAHQIRFGLEYEVGCLSCPAFVHKDGSVRDVGARGGPLPRHAVEAWNEGPDYWMKTQNPDRERAARRTS